MAKKTGRKLDKGQFVKFEKYLRLYYVLPKNLFYAIGFVSVEIKTLRRLLLRLLSALCS